MLGKRIKGLDGREWEFVGNNDIGVPYFSKVVTGKVQKKQFTVAGFEKPWAENEITKPVIKDSLTTEKAEGREPWEMTKQGYINKEADYLADLLDKQGKHKIAARARGDEFRKNYGPDDNPAKWAQIHKKAIQQALKENKPVPPEVLAEYPDLVKGKPPPPKEKLPEQPVSEPGKELEPIPKDLKGIKVNVKAIRQATGETIEIQEDAQVAMDSVKSQIDTYNKIINCLAG